MVLTPRRLGWTWKSCFPLPTSTNAVNNSHTFTATVEENLGNGAGFVPVPAGTPVTFSLVGSNTAGATITSTNPTVTGGINGDTATVTVLDASNKTGSVSINASTTLAVGAALPAITRSTGDADPNDGPNATKTWVDLEIALTPPTSTNAVNNSHTFTATVEEDLGNGAGFVPVPAGTPVNFSLVGANTAGATITSTNPTVTGGINGDTATVTVLDASNKTGSVSVNASTTLAVGGVSPAITRSTGDSDPNDSANATKTWVDLEIKLDANSVNPVNQSHTFTATVEEDLGNGAGFVAVPTGTPVTFSLSGNTAGATITSTNPTTTTGDTATVTVLDASYKTGIVTVNASTTLAVAGVSPAITRSTGDSDPNDGPNATKTWVDLEIVLTPPTSTNAVNNSHTFTATVEEDLGNGAGFVPVPAGTPVNFSLVGSNTAGATITSTNPTVTGGITGDTATVTVLDASNKTGSVSVNASTTLAVGGVSPAITRSTGDSDPNDSANATKTWVDLEIKLDANSVNPVNQSHTFTATVEEDLGKGGWVRPRYPPARPSPSASRVPILPVQRSPRPTRR